MFYFLFLFIIGLPVLEIWILIKLGGLFGLWGTLLLVIGTAIFGLFHLRVQGFGLIFNLQKKLLSGQRPVAELVEGFGLIISGFFFIIPGAITDLVGLIFLIPHSRRFFLKIIISYIIDRLREKGH